MSLFSNSSSGLFSSSSNNNNNLFSGSSNNNNNLFSGSANPNSNLFSSSSNQNNLLSNSSGLFSQSLFSQPQDKILDNIDCPGSHQLILTSNLQRINPNYYQNRYQCDMCKQSLISSTSPAAHCNSCVFDLCPPCLAKYQPSLYQCDAKHGLSKIIDGVDLFSDKYECQYCECFFPVKENPPMGCKLCFFYLCRECFQNRGQSKTLRMNQGPVRKTHTKEEVKEAAEDHEIQENNEENRCSGCREGKKTHLLLPCGHVCACNKCSTDLVDTKGECPECKKQVEKRVKVF